MRRLLAIIAMAVFAVFAGAGAAHADIVAPEPESPRAALVNEPPTNPGSGRFSTTGLAGWGSHRADPGSDSLMLVEDSGPNLAANMIMDFTTFLISAAVSSADEVLGEDSWIRILDGIDDGMRRLGGGAWVLFGVLAIIVSTVYVMVGATRGDLAGDVKKYAGTWGVIVSAMLMLVWPVAVGPYVDQGVRATYDAVTAVAVSDGTDQSTSAAIGDSLSDGIAWPVWLYMHFGHDEVAKDKYGERLWAASTLTWEEQLRIDNNPREASDLHTAKREDYIKVASEVRDERPQTWGVLAGGDSTARMWWSFLAFIGVGIPAVVLIGCMWLALLLLVAVRLFVYVWPLLALVVMFPRAHFIAARIAREFGKGMVACAAAMVGYVAVVRIVVPAFILSDLHIYAKVLAMVSLAGIVGYMWAIRKRIYDRFSTRDLFKNLDSIRSAAAGRVGSAAEHAGDTYRAGARKVEAGLSYRDGRPVDLGETAGDAGDFVAAVATRRPVQAAKAGAEVVLAIDAAKDAAIERVTRRGEDDARPARWHPGDSGDGGPIAEVGPGVRAPDPLFVLPGIPVDVDTPAGQSHRPPVKDAQPVHVELKPKIRLADVEPGVSARVPVATEAPKAKPVNLGMPAPGEGRGAKETEVAA